MDSGLATLRWRAGMTDPFVDGACDRFHRIDLPGREQTDMIPVAHIEHQLPGRVRLRVPSRRGEVPFFESVVQELSKHPAIRELTATSLTGSITLHYFEPLQPITAAAADQKLFETRRSEPQTNVSESKQPARLGEGSGLADGVATGLTGLSLYQVALHNPIPLHT
jgi:hypothetical protein